MCLKREVDLLQVRAKPEIQHGLIFNIQYVICEIMFQIKDKFPRIGSS